MPVILVCDCCGRVPEGCICDAWCICDPSCAPDLKEREVTEEVARAYAHQLKHLPVPALPEGDDEP